MNDLATQIVAGLVVIAISGIGGFLIRKRFFPENRVLPEARRYVEKQGYSHLNGKWHFYWISYAPANPSEPVWLKGAQFFEINKNRLKGTTEHIGHPLGDLHFRIQGEIRAGRLLFTDTCIEDETDYASALFPNLRSPTLLVGMWVGLDNLMRPIAAPCVLSRKELTAEKLNEAIRSSTMSLVPIGEFKSYFDLHEA